MGTNGMKIQCGECGNEFSKNCEDGDRVNCPKCHEPLIVEKVSNSEAEGFTPINAVLGTTHIPPTEEEKKRYEEWIT